MISYIALGKFTPKGAEAIQDTVRRSDEAAKVAKKLNVEFKSIYWTTGLYDFVVLLEAENEADIMAFSIALKKQGFVTSDGLRAYTKAEMNDVLGNLTKLQ